MQRHERYGSAGCLNNVQVLSSSRWIWRSAALFRSVWSISLSIPTYYWRVAHPFFRQICAHMRVGNLVLCRSDRLKKAYAAKRIRMAGVPLSSSSTSHANG